MPEKGVVMITSSGNYGISGTTYRLANDITSERSAVFLGKDVTLDLNGYTIKYADGGYGHIANSGFEEGEKGWDLSRAPGAKVVNTAEVHVFVGDKLMSLKAGDQITSSYVYLPVANRSYFAMCGVTGFDYHEMGANEKNQMKVSVFVEDEKGHEIRTTTQYGDTSLVSCPVERKSPRLGGGFVYAHLNKLPAGRYRIRVRADTDCKVDEIDIRPSMDAGIGIVDKTAPMGHYDHLFNSDLAAFFDYTSDVVNKTSLPGIPVAHGKGSVTIKNGTIENGAIGAVSWGIQSTADDVRVILDNVHIKTSGINTIAVDVPQATITHCKFEVNNPFIINRHFSNFYAVDIRGEDPSEVSYSEFFGGQGCLVFKGKKSSIHHNYLVNHQMVTNHYSIMAMGDSSRVFENRIEPEVGSGIEIYVNKYIEIFNNSIKIQTSPPTCEYGHEEYSTNAIRLADYGASTGSPDGAYGNKIYNNNISIIGKLFDGPNFTPMCYGIYYSASGGVNEVFGNDITVEKLDTASKVITAAFYICGGTKGSGGNFFNNRIYTNVTAGWVASMYGGAVNTSIYNNTIIANPSGGSFKTFRIGWSQRKDCFAKNVDFRSNIVEGSSFSLDVSDQDHSYAVYWTLSLKLTNKKGKLMVNELVTILDADKNIMLQQKTNERGELSAELPEYAVDGHIKKSSSPYIIKAGNVSMTVPLDKNADISFVIKK
ncbi:MAG: hypothetical protein ABI687_07135 [Flavitalea sp.]